MSENEQAILKKFSKAYTDLSKEGKQGLCLMAQGFVIANELNELEKEANERQEQEGTE